MQGKELSLFFKANLVLFVTDPDIDDILNESDDSSDEEESKPAPTKKSQS